MSHPLTLHGVQNPAQCLACFAVMRELGPRLQDAQAFVAQVLRQAGYRLQENTLYGRVVYIDDLIVLPQLQRTTRFYFNCAIEIAS